MFYDPIKEFPIARPKGAFESLSRMENMTTATCEPHRGYEILIGKSIQTNLGANEENTNREKSGISNDIHQVMITTSNKSCRITPPQEKEVDIEDTAKLQKKY